MKLNIRFLEPFRLAYWKEHNKRNNHDKEYMRGRAFAQWHRCGSNEEGQLYITGYLLRSHMIRAAETLLTLSDGKVDGIACCPGNFQTDPEVRNIKIQKISGGKYSDVTTDKTIINEAFQARRKHPLERNTSDNCCTDDSPCPFCILLGQGSRKKNRTQPKDRWIHFDNLILPGDPRFNSIKDIADERMINRVDYSTGKAHDFYKIYEIDHTLYPCVEGSIRFAEYKAESDTAEKKWQVAQELLKDSLRFVDRLCGALCIITVNDEKPCKDLPGCKDGNNKENTDYYEDKKTVEEIKEIVTSNNPDKFGVLSKAFLLLGKDRTQVKSLVCNHEGKKEHYLWDMKKEKKGDSIRDIIEKKTENPNDWKKFCEYSAAELHKEFKKLQGGISLSTRILGNRQAYESSEQESFSHRVKPLDMKETLIYGNFVAETPFFFGLESDNPDPDLKVLIDRQNRFRLPRSVLRGILRRDLRTALGTGCDAPLGKGICNCEVCLIMENITVQDSRSKDGIPLETRTRIRINPFTGTVSEGALFDMEVGPKGTSFPFVLRYRGKGNLPNELETVLYWWTQGLAFLGGAVSTGKSRFRLADSRMEIFDLSKEEKRKEYLKHAGWRGTEAEKTSDFKLFRPEKRKDFPWEGVKIFIDLDSPFLNGDPVRALLENDVKKEGTDGRVGADIVSFMTYTDAGKSKEYAYKGESFRGVVRTAVGRIAKPEKDMMSGDWHPPLVISHNDCDCVICRIFGSEYETGKLRFEDLTFVNTPNPRLFDHVAIDRFTGGAVDKKKFDDVSLTAPVQPNGFTLSGCLWIRNDISKNETAILQDALADIKNGMYPLGGKAGTGYGQVKDLRIQSSGTIAGKLQNFLKTVSRNTQAKPEIPPKAVFDGSYILNKITPDKIFYPHYFLEPAQNVTVKRDEKVPVSHHTLDEKLLTGFIECKLDTLSPLIIPDSFDVKEDEKSHKSYNFMMLNGKPVIPGSALRGMVSTVFEALTNSCFRIFDEKYRLSWRMSADVKVLENFNPGRIIFDPERKTEKSNGFFMEEMRKTEIRYPFYDYSYCQDRNSQQKYFERNQSLKLTDISIKNIRKEKIPEYILTKLNSIKNRRYKSEKGFLWDLEKTLGKHDMRKYELLILKHTELAGDVTYYDHPTPTDQKMLSLVYPNRTMATLNLLSKYTIIKHRKSARDMEQEGFMFVATPSKNKEGYNSQDIFEENGQREFNGYLKITGPNKVEKENAYKLNLPSKPSDINSLTHNDSPRFCDATIPCTKERKEDCKRVHFKTVTCEKEKGEECRRKRIVPEYAYSEQNKNKPSECVTYTMTKRSERVFLTKEGGKKFPITDLTINKFKILVEEYRSNAEHHETPKVFQTLLPENGTINHGDLVYYRKNEKDEVVEIIPVRISREVDDKYIAEHFFENKDLRPCHGEWIGEEDLSPLNPYPEKKLLTRHKDGLCPACRVFGTGAYKGRINFSFAELQEETKWQNDAKGITLPLLERPRPTWSVPDKKAEIPGRKFYIHHKGWESICTDGKQPGTGKEIVADKNNRTVKALAPENSFTFKVHFENLREHELGLLLWSLQLEQGLAHKLGMGKSFGFGSVNIRVENVNCICFTGNDQDSHHKKEWENRNHEVEDWIRSGKEKLKIWFGKEWNETEHINHLHQLLFYTEEKRPNVYYPSLEPEQDEKTAEKTTCYKSLKKDKEKLKKLFSIPWHPWHESGDKI